MSSSGDCEFAQDRDFSEYLALYNAAVSGDWKTANTLFFERNIEETEAVISNEHETALHVAVQSGRANEFVRELVSVMRPEALALQNRSGNTALHEAAVVGNTEAAKVMLEKNPGLLYMKSSLDEFAVLIAAIYSQKETLEYLISVSKPNVENTPFEGQEGVVLLIEIIACEFFDVALDLVEKYPNLARLGLPNNRCAFSFLAEKESAFLSRERFSWWEKLIYMVGIKLPEEGLNFL